jgi:hypothetical protein
MARGDIVMLADADVMFLRDFSSLLYGIKAAPAICGVMAHVSPFRHPPKLTPRYAGRHSRDGGVLDYWTLLAEHFGVSNLVSEHEYSGWNIMERNPQHRYAPAYYNGGMVVGPAALMEQMFESYSAAETAVDEVMDTYYLPQLVYRERLPHRVLPVRYNFPNDPGFDAAYPDEMNQVAVLHYLREQVVHRIKDFEDLPSVERLVTRTDLTGWNEALRARVAELVDVVRAGEGARA